MSENTTPDLTVPATDRRRPSSKERDRGAAAAKRLLERPEPVRLKITRDDDNGTLTIGSEHADVALHSTVMKDALGTGSTAHVEAVLNDLLDAIPGDPQMRVNAALALFDSLKPRDEAEALLVAQMAAAHAGAMRCSGYMQRGEWMPQIEGMGRMAVKFMGAYARHLETLRRLRAKSEASVSVGRVDVAAGGQAVVGVVNTGVREKPDEQAHAPGR